MLEYKLRYYELRYLQVTKNDLKNYILTAIATMILTVLSVNISGIIGLIFLAYNAAFIGYSVTRHHYGYVAILCCLVAVVYGFFGGTFVSLLSALPIILCGLSLGISFNLKFSQYKTLFIVTSVYVLYMVINMKLSGLATDFSSILTEAISSAYPLYEGVISQSDYNVFASQLLSVFIKFMPAFIVIFCTCYGFLLLVAFRSVLNKSKTEPANFITLSQWRAEKSFSISFLALLVISLLLPSGNVYSDAIANVILISSFIFFAFGFSLLLYILKKRAKTPALAKISAFFILVISIVFIGFPYMILSVMGVMDGFINYREKQKN